MSSELIYKIVSTSEWAQAQSQGVYRGSQDDRRDGFIHLSTRAQLAGTLHKHFAHKTDLKLVAFRVFDLADNLKWEPSRGGALFPHYYAPLPTQLAVNAEKLELDREGQFCLPDATR